MPVDMSRAEVIVEKIWKTYDVDRSGFLDPEQAKTLFDIIFKNEGIELTDEQHESIFQAVDLNGDGMISKEEMVNLLVEYT